MIKGSSYHVMPYDSGWCVIGEGNQQVIAHFDSQQTAMAYATACAENSEGQVLLHNSQGEAPYELSTVLLPRQETLPDLAHQGQVDGMLYAQQSWEENSAHPEFDPLLGFDEGYFEI